MLELVQQACSLLTVGKAFPVDFWEQQSLDELLDEMPKWMDAIDSLKKARQHLFPTYSENLLAM